MSVGVSSLSAFMSYRRATPVCTRNNFTPIQALIYPVSNDKLIAVSSKRNRIRIVVIRRN